MPGPIPKPFDDAADWLGRLKSAALARMTETQLAHLRRVAGCIQTVVALELARRQPGRAIHVRHVSVSE